VALKLAGVPVEDALMARLRQRILELGTFRRPTALVKVNPQPLRPLSAQYCPSIPPEVVLLPFHFLYQMSAWTRAM